jgi:Cu/Ag efflux protein CusF
MISLLAILGVAVAFALPVEMASAQAQEHVAQSTSGIIQEVNAQTGTIIFRSETGKTLELQVPAAQLTDLHVGDVVQVRVSRKQGTAIGKESAPQAWPRPTVWTEHPGSGGE